MDTQKALTLTTIVLNLVSEGHCYIYKFFKA